MNESQAGPNNLLDTTDCLEAVGVFKGWKNFLFVIVLLCLLVLQASFWLVDTGCVKIDEQQALGSEPAVMGNMTQPAGGTAEPANANVPKAVKPVPEPMVAPNEPEKATEPEKAAEPETPAEPEKAAEPETPAEPEKAAEPQKPAEPEQVNEPANAVEPNQATESSEATEPNEVAEPNQAVEPNEEAEPNEPTANAAERNLQLAITWPPTDFLSGITFEFLSWVIRVANAVLILTASLYCLSMLFSLKVSMLGRLGGINHISRAFFLSLLMLILLLPWQRIFGSMVPGAIFTPKELAKWYFTEPGDVFDKVVYYLRFSGYWLLILLLLILSHIRSIRWGKAILRRLEII
jgi:hypothetical protein